MFLTRHPYYSNLTSYLQETLDSSHFNLKTAADNVKKWSRNKAESGNHSATGLAVEAVGCVGEGRVGGVDSLLQLPAVVLACIHALHSYLSQFNLQQVCLNQGQLFDRQAALL